MLSDTWRTNFGLLQKLSWRNLENNALSSLLYLSRNRLVGVPLAGRLVGIYVKTTVHCSPDFSMVIVMNIFLYRYDNGDVKVWDLRHMKECWETTVGRCLFCTIYVSDSVLSRTFKPSSKKKTLLQKFFW
jgi:hypothetical protein